jgi:hypothetical protein
LTIRIKVVEPQILAKLQEELLKPGTLAYITKAVEREVKKAESARPKDGAATMKRLEQERRKLQNLVAALEGGSSSPVAVLKAVLKAIAERETVIAELESQILSAPAPKAVANVEVTPAWVGTQLADLAF